MTIWWPNVHRHIRQNYRPNDSVLPPISLLNIWSCHLAVPPKLLHRARQMPLSDDFPDQRRRPFVCQPIPFVMYKNRSCRHRMTYGWSLSQPARWRGPLSECAPVCGPVAASRAAINGPGGGRWMEGRRRADGDNGGVDGLIKG